ncbi:DUF3685 domain-containing protein [Aliterella atlantica]|uniref:Regulator n=1 Tax=Aliterella atlantica CENA595 TaxID=1618023 RepID=A0A0D8ZY00_9CYAN|nr:DUF3685 domain-containing protein [Aliterella atlantica]KJH73314.1 regulator [Aliterella atlantica CENA595]
MSDRALRLLLIDNDPIFCTGLQVLLEEFSDIAVVAADSDSNVLQILATSDRSLINLVVLALDADGSNFAIVQQIKAQYPNLPILLLGTVPASQLSTAKAVGVEGYCPKGSSISEVVAIARQVAAGQSYWTTDIAAIPRLNIFSTIRENWRLSGLQQIDFTLTQVTAQLQIPGLTVLERAILSGQRRELLASRWLVNQLLKPSQVEISNSTFAGNLTTSSLTYRQDLALLPTQTSNNSQLTQISASIFASVQAKLQFSLDNLTGVPLEIDLLREDRKRELLATVLTKVSNIVAQLQFAQVKSAQLPKMKAVIVQDLWQTSTVEYFGKYSTILVGEQNIEIANYLLQDVLIVQTGILNKIPLVIQLFSYLLFDTPLVVDNVAYSVGSPEAMARAEIILQNLIVEIANAVVQPLLNRLADVEVVKQNFYDRSLISNREIERFRNSLSWKYRFKEYIDEPKKIFESRYELFILAERGIAKLPIYAPRNQELKQLSGIPAIVTLALEFRDAIAPRLRAAVAFLGSGVVYVLTQVVGRAIGLIGRGILQGLGGSLPQNKYGKDSERFK